MDEIKKTTVALSDSSTAEVYFHLLSFLNCSRRNVMYFSRLVAVTLNTKASCSSCSQSCWICKLVAQYCTQVYSEINCLCSVGELLWPFGNVVRSSAHPEAEDCAEGHISIMLKWSSCKPFKSGRFLNREAKKIFT